MAESDLDTVANLLAKTNLALGGVSFEGKSLKLNNKADAEEVVKQIESCSELSYLNMAGNTLGVEAAEAIAKALEKHPEFKRALWKDMFTGRMKEEIPKALKHLGDGLVTAGAQLVELDLSDNAFGPIGVGGLAALLRSRPCYTLQELRLNNNGLGITGGKMLAEGLLQCHRNSKAEGKGLALKVFIAGRNRLENPGAIALAEVFKTLGTLREVVMPQNGIYHPGVKALSDAFKHNTELEVLNLNDNTLTRRGAAAIAEALPVLLKLRVLNLGDCLLKTKGSILIAEALTAQHTQLEDVILSGNEMCLRGGLAVAQALQGRPSLKLVDLNDNPLGKKGWTDIKSQLQSVLAVANDDEADDDEEEEVEEEEESDDDEEEDEDDEVKENGEDEDDDDEYEDEEEEEIFVEENQNDKPTVIRTISPTNSATTVPQFLEAPSAVRLIALSADGDHVSILRHYVETFSDDIFVDQILSLIMKVSALSTHNQDAAKPIALEASEALYSDLFSWVERKGQSVLTIVNNALLVHLGLIKSEDKKMKIFWNLEGCLVSLNAVLMKKIIPVSTRELLRFFLERPESRVEFPAKIKQEILATLRKTLNSTTS